MTLTNVLRAFVWVIWTPSVYRQMWLQQGLYWLVSELSPHHPHPRLWPALTTLAALEPSIRLIGAWDRAWPSWEPSGDIWLRLLTASRSRMGLRNWPACLVPFSWWPQSPHPTTVSSELLGGGWGGSLLPADRPNLAGVRGHASGHHLPLAPIQQVPSLLPPPVNSPSLPSPSLSKIEVVGSRSRSIRGAGGLVYLTPC